MADQNQSNKKGMNTFADDIDRSSTLSELERIGARASRKGIQRTQLEDRIRSEGKSLNSLMDLGRSNPELRDSPFYQEQTSGLQESIRGIRGKMNSLDSTARSRAEVEASNYISRQFSGSAIGKQSSSMQREAATQNRAFSMMGMSYDQLQGQREDVLADIRVRERNAQNEVKGMFSGRGQVDPEKSAALGVMMGGTSDHIRQLATINAAQTLQRASGSDPLSKVKGLGEMGATANSILSAESIAQEVRGGGIGISSGGKMGTVANEDIGKEIITQARALSQALKELAEGAGKTDEELQKLRTTADESAANLDKLQKAEGAGGGGGRGTIMGYLSGAGGAFNALGGAAQQVMVNQRMQETANIGGFAGLANQQYDMYGKARAGDVASQMALTQFGDANQFGMEMKRGTNVAQTAYLASGAMQTVAGGMQVAEGLKNAPTAGYLNSGVGNNLAQGGQNLIQGAATLGVTAADMARGTSAQAARLAGIQSNMSARQAVNYVGARQAQGLRDFYTGLDTAGQEMGSGAGSFITNAVSGDNLQRMQAARMSPEQYVKLSGFGASAMGSTFSGNSVFGARNLESAGFGSMQTNMSRMATLSTAGGNNPGASMQGVLEAAFSRSLDSSKALNMMVENTAAMAQGTSAAASGIDVTGATATMLAAGVNSNMGNREAALQQAVEAAQLTGGITTNRSATFSGMVNTAAISQKTGVSGVEAIIAQGLSIQEFKAMQGAGPQKAAEFYKNQGINISSDKADEFTNEMLRQKQMQIMRDKGIALNIKNPAGLLDRVNSGTETGADTFALAQAASLSGYKGGAGQIKREILGVTAQNSQEGMDKASAAFGGSGDDIKKQMDALRTGGFKQLTEAAASASKDLEKFGGALKVFTDLQNKFEKGGMDNEKEFSTAGSKFAETFSASTSLFRDSVSDFDRAVQKLSNSAGLRSNAIPAVPNFVTDGMNQLKGSTRGK